METVTAATKIPAVVLTNNARNIIAPAVLFGCSDARDNAWLAGFIQPHLNFFIRSIAATRIESGGKVLSLRR